MSCAPFLISFWYRGKRQTSVWRSSSTHSMMSTSSPRSLSSSPWQISCGSVGGRGEANCEVNTVRCEPIVFFTKRANQAAVLDEERSRNLIWSAQNEIER